MREAKCQAITSIIEELAPKKLAESWDNVGLLIGDGSSVVKKVMISLDAPEWVIDEAIDKEIDLIICHHPMIFNPIKKVNTDNFLGRKIIKLIKNNISLYAFHTNYDIAQNGLNEVLARRLGFLETLVIEPSFFNDKIGFGRLCKIESPLNLLEYANYLKQQLELNSIRVGGDLNKIIKKVAILNGSGSKFIQAAKKSGADLLITGDISYHDMLDAIEMGLCIIDASHYGTEKIMIDSISVFLEQRLSELKYDVCVIKSKTNIDPIVIL